LDRGIRRHHRERLKKKREREIFSRWCYNEPTDRDIGVSIDTPCPCSCPWCGNPRRHFGEKTVQERREPCIY